MRIKLVMAGGAPEAAGPVFKAYARAQITRWVATMPEGDAGGRGKLLRLLADLMTDIGSGGKYSAVLSDAVDAMSGEAVAELAALCGTCGRLLLMTPEQMVAIHDAEGDAVTGTAIAGFMMDRALSGAERQVLSHLVCTLDAGQRRSLISMVVALLVTFGFTASEVAALYHPGDAMTPGMPDPCQPIGCDNGIHVAGCPYATVDSQD